MENTTRYFCEQLHLGDVKMYHYSDEVIYDKHLTEDSVIETKNEKREYNDTK